MVRESDIRVIEAEAYFSDEIAREALRFGAAVAATLTLCHVRVRVENRRGLVAVGWGAVFLSHYWAFPSPTVTPADKDAAMRRTTEALCALVVSSEQYGHPIDLFRDIEQSLATTSARVCRESGVTETMPYLGALVCMSPIDAAIHDAFGNVNGICTYAGYGADYCSNDLSAYLGPRYRDRYLADVLRPDPAPRVLIAHTVGHADALTPGDVRPDAPEDSRPKSLAEWIAREGLCCFKVKLRGTDLAWDIDRYLSVFRTAQEARAGDDHHAIHCSVDANEQCAAPVYMVEFLAQVRQSNLGAFAALRYVEQPTERDLYLHRYDMRELAALKPVIIDESLTRLADLDEAIARGWSGVALKTCKCQSLVLLIAARARCEGLMHMVQDLTNPGIALLQSIGLAAHIESPLAVEANARQYYPDTSSPEVSVHPGVFMVHEGQAETGTIRGNGLGYQMERIDRAIFRPSRLSS
jgi:L-alanine-DL-glutamate epimerase-like enolase superfamily enzyme